MKILAIDSSGLVASVALYEEGQLLGEYTLNTKLTHSETLLPMIENLMKISGTEKNAIDAICVAEGPGSFTGLRIGVATAKGLGLALGKPVIGVPTVEAMAYNYYDSEALVVPMMDARRNQVYGGAFQFANAEQVENLLFVDGNGKGLQALVETDALPAEMLVQKAAALVKEGKAKQIIFLGDGVQPNTGSIASCDVPYQIAPAPLSRQRAAYIAQVGESLLKNGVNTSAADMKPNYLRPSQAERERAEKMGEA